MLMIGGPRHGGDIPVDDATRSYVDIVSATTYHRRRFVRVFPHPVTGQPAHAFAQELLVHESVPDHVHAQMGVADLLIARWFREQGTEVPLDQAPGLAPSPQEGPAS
ncbi:MULTISPECIES: hypothetical protein [Micromonospora]|uniref:hypothetical protein n=1 Tax=Micromonospora TaxID=1873 RepID=UPI0013BAA8C2|nr:hypothetical protein [Micromonospora aurantiaca]